MTLYARLLTALAHADRAEKALNPSSGVLQVLLCAVGLGVLVWLGCVL